MTSFHTALSSSGRSVTVITTDDGKVDILNDSHPNYLRVLDALNNNEDHAVWMNPSLDAVIDDDRFSTEGGTATFDGEDVSVLSAVIDRYRRDGRDTTNLIRFMELLLLNPSQNSREQLFLWAQAKDLTIDAEGFIVGYKGVNSRTSDLDFLDEDGNPLFPLAQYPYCSSNSGHGIVDGHDIRGHLPMGVGAVIEMPRNEVNDNTHVGCASGLHVGTYSYAKGWASSGALFQVRFNPADVVSVPNDCNFHKLRCCRYEVVAIHNADVDDLTVHEPEATWDEDGAMEEFMAMVPEGWVTRLRNRIRNLRSN